MKKNYFFYVLVFLPNFVLMRLYRQMMTLTFGRILKVLNIPKILHDPRAPQGDMGMPGM